MPGVHRASAALAVLLGALSCPSARAESAQSARKQAETALAEAKRAVQQAPESAQAHLDLAIAYGKWTDFVGNKTKLEISKLIREEAAKAAELDPANDLAWSVLGRWHYGLANVNGVLKALAGVVFGGMPDASNAEAAKYLEKAAALAPQRICHHADLARAYEALGRKSDARAQWQAVARLPAVDEEDRKEKENARKALN